MGDLVSVATEKDRTLYFDFLPLDLGPIKGMKTSFQLYTVPGQIFYDATRRIVLEGADGVVFVADSHPDMMIENIESLENLDDNLRANGLDLETTPLIFQWNKRDLDDAMPVDEIAMGADVEKGVRPATPFHVDAPVLDVPGGDAVAGELCGGRAEVLEVSERHPAAAMNHDRDGMRPRSLGQAQIAELDGIAAVDDSMIGQRCRGRQYVLRRHELEVRRWLPVPTLRRAHRSHRTVHQPRYSNDCDQQ